MRISIVTITYNAARNLQCTLDSVSQQSYRLLEHLIIDGVSKDGTLSMAQHYKETADYEVVVKSEPDKGLYDAMNKGLQKATGDYIVFLNAGDTLHDADTLKNVVTAAGKQTSALPAVIYGDTAITDSEGHFLHLRAHRPPEALSWRSFKQGMLVCHQAFYVRTDIAKQFLYNLQFRHSADVDWCIRVMKEAARQGLPLVNTHKVLANFEEGGNTTQHHRSSLNELFRVMTIHYGLLQTIGLHAWFVIRALYRRLYKKDTR